MGEVGRFEPAPEGVPKDEHSELRLDQADVPPEGGLVGLDFGPPIERGYLLPSHIKRKSRGFFLLRPDTNNWDID